MAAVIRRPSWCSSPPRSWPGGRCASSTPPARGSRVARSRASAQAALVRDPEPRPDVLVIEMLDVD
jgi:hypothetical protein